MRRIYHPESGAFEFFQEPEDKLMGEISRENKELKEKLNLIENMLKKIQPKTASVIDELGSLNKSQLQTVANELDIKFASNCKASTLVDKISNSDNSEDDILKAVEKVK